MPNIPELIIKRPIDEKLKIIKKFHCSLTGHKGIKSTIISIKDSGKNWATIRQDVTYYIQRCAQCQLNPRSIKLPHFKNRTTEVYEPFQGIAMDTTGPFNMDTRGNKYFITFICTFSRFVEIIPVKDTTSVEAAIALLQIVGRYGIPEFIRSDNGTQFVNEVIDQLIALMGSTHDNTIPYRPQSNGMVERSTQETLTHLRALVFDFRRYNEWSTLLPLAQRIINSSPHRSLGGICPSQLIYANSVSLDRGIIKEHKIPTSYPLASFLILLCQQQSRIMKLNQQYQARTSDNYANLNAESNEVVSPYEIFKINEYVSVVPATEPTKLAPRLLGPFKIVGINDNDMFDLHDPISKKVLHLHSTRLLNFKIEDGASDFTINSYVNRSNEMYLVDFIVKHRGNLRDTSTLQFHIRWLGYSSDDDSWVSLTDIKNTEAFIEYAHQFPHFNLERYLTTQQIDEPISIATPINQPILLIINDKITNSSEDKVTTYIPIFNHYSDDDTEYRSFYNHINAIAESQQNNNEVILEDSEGEMNEDFGHDDDVVNEIDNNLLNLNSNIIEVEFPVTNELDSKHGHDSTFENDEYAKNIYYYDSKARHEHSLVAKSNPSGNKYFDPELEFNKNPIIQVISYQFKKAPPYTIYNEHTYFETQQKFSIEGKHTSRNNDWDHTLQYNSTIRKRPQMIVWDKTQLKISFMSGLPIDSLDIDILKNLWSLYNALDERRSLILHFELNLTMSKELDTYSYTHIPINDSQIRSFADFDDPTKDDPSDILLQIENELMNRGFPEGAFDNESTLYEYKLEEVIRKIPIYKDRMNDDEITIDGFDQEDVIGNKYFDTDLKFNNKEDQPNNLRDMSQITKGRAEYYEEFKFGISKNFISVYKERYRPVEIQHEWDHTMIDNNNLTDKQFEHIILSRKAISYIMNKEYEELPIDCFPSLYLIYSELATRYNTIKDNNLNLLETKILDINYYLHVPIPDTQPRCYQDTQINNAFQSRREREINHPTPTFERALIAEIYVVELEEERKKANRIT